MQHKWMVIMTTLVLFSLLLAPAGMARAQEPNPFAKRLPAGGLILQPPQASTAVLPLTPPNVIRDPSFEASYGSQAYWGQASANYGSPLCRAADCGNGAGTAGPRSGSTWVWFGGVDFTEPNSSNPEGAQIYQYVNIPSCGAVLQFYLWIGAAQPGSNAEDFFNARLNGRRIFQADATQKNLYPRYTLVTVNIAPGTFTPDSQGQNILYFSSIVSDQLVTFNLDDVTLTPNCLTVSGKIGSLEGVTLNYTGGSTTTDHDGNYSLNVPAGWSGTVTPSKTGYTFSPVSRTYTNIAVNQTNQNYTASIIRYPITGNVGVADVILSYQEWGDIRVVRSQSNGNYSIPMPYGGSSTITPGHYFNCFTFTPVERAYSSVTAPQSGQDYTPAFVSDSGCADFSARIGGINRGRFGLGHGDSTRTSFSSLDSGPVEIISANAIPLIAAERVIYRVNNVPTSFSEIIALPNSQLDTTYWLPWYNNKDLNTQLRFANVSNSEATVQITIGTNDMGSFVLAPGASTRKSFAGLDAGPVKIQSNVNIVAAERVIFRVNNVDTSFSEMIALPNSQLDTTYWLPWYNNKDMDTQLRFANVSDQEATVHVTIGAFDMGSFAIAPGASTRKSFAGIDAGPVKIESNVNIVTAERVIYKVNSVPTSFSETMAMPASQLDTTYWLPWYNNKDLNTQLRIANVSSIDATVHVFIGGIEMPGSPFVLAPGASTRRSYIDVDRGPVKVESNVPIVAAERVIYKVNGVDTSFSEMMGLPNSLLDTHYWLPWYNNKDLDTQLRFGVP